jgi:hypothetical protein
MDTQDLPAKTPKDLANSPGFTVVEDDDVAFGVALSREVHRIYGLYMADELPATDSVQAGLMLTMEMFTTLQNSVTDGMPALRLQVGSAQVREMLGTLFGYDLPTRRSRELPPDRQRARVHRSSRSIATHTARHAIERPSPGPVQDDRKELVEQNPSAPLQETNVPPATASATAGEISAPLAGASRPGGLAQYWEKQPLLVQVVATLVGIVLAALLIDAPFAIVALFPNYLFPLTALFVGVFVASKPAFRIIRSRRYASTWAGQEFAGGR